MRNALGCRQPERVGAIVARHAGFSDTRGVSTTALAKEPAFGTRRAARVSIATLRRRARGAGVRSGGGIPAGARAVGWQLAARARSVRRSEPRTFARTGLDAAGAG